MSLHLTTEKTNIYGKHKSNLGGSDLLGGPCKTEVIGDNPIIASTPNLHNRGKSMAGGFIKLSREVEDLVVTDPDVFVLLTLIALRALRSESKFNRHNLQIHEAVIGYQDLPWTEQRYREVKKRTEQKYGLATFKGTTKGTVAKLTSTAVYDINVNNGNDPHNERTTTTATNEQRPNNDPTTTKEEYKKEKNVRKKSTTSKPPPSSEAMEVYDFFVESMKRFIPHVALPKPETAHNFDLLLKLHEKEKIKKLITFAHTGFWSDYVHGPLYFKNKFKNISESQERDFKKNSWKKESPKVAPTFEPSVVGGPHVEIM